MKVTVCRKVHFNAAHRLCNPAWDDQKNDQVFGVCSNPHYHGHNYDLVVKLTGEVSPDTGFVYNMKELKELMEELVIARYDHKNLNLEVEEFRKVNPTAENIAIAIWNIMRAHIDPSLDIQIVLYETERNFVEYSGE